MICFHHNDMDGRCSAAIVKKWRELHRQDGSRDLFIELDYKDRVPIEKIEPNELVVIVDFSFKPEIMQKVFEITGQVIWCDHHKTAAEYDYGRDIDGIREFEEKKLAGCECTWKYFFPEVEVPRIVRLIGDRDKWAWKYGEETAKANQGVKIYDTQPESKDWLHLFNYLGVIEAIKHGETCLKFRDSFCKDYCNSYGFETEFEGYKAFALGIYMFGSEAFGDKFKQYPLCISFVYDGNKWTTGLYSETIDVGEIARKFGGGGHKGAAGFTSEMPFWKISI